MGTVSANMRGTLPDMGLLWRWYDCRDVDICALEMEVTMEWNTDFEVSTTSWTAIFEVELTVVTGNVYMMGLRRAEVSCRQHLDDDVLIRHQPA